MHDGRQFLSYSPKQETLFSVMFQTHLRKLEENRFLAVFFFLLEFAQMYLFILDPVWGWDFDPTRRVHIWSV